MGPQVARLSESFRANITFERLFASVSPHVNFKRARSHETLLAAATLEWALPCVPPEVIAQVTMRRERPVAALEGAHEWLLAIVDPLVRFEVALLREPLLTARKVAFKGLLACVSALVDFEPASARVGLAADVALERFVARVDQFMGLQVSLRDESLAAVYKCADEGPLARVYPQVRLQIASLLEVSQTLHERAE